MRRTRTATHISITVAVSLLLASCGPMRVDSYVQRGLDVRQYHTYAWAIPDTFSTGDPRLDNNPFFSDRIQRAVDSHLQRKGFERVEGRQPDVFLHYHARVEQHLNSADLRIADPGCHPEDCRPFVYDAGTLLIEMVDRRTNRLVWRGWAERGLDGVIDNQTWMDDAVDDAVRRIMERFPS